MLRVPCSQKGGRGAVLQPGVPHRAMKTGPVASLDWGACHECRMLPSTRQSTVVAVASDVSGRGVGSEG